MPAKSAEEADTPMILNTLGKYELLEKIGRGTTADVYRAKDTALNRQVALKVIEAALEDNEAYLREARLLDRLRHPNIVQVHGADRIEGRIVIDMELLPGATLEGRLKEKGALPLDEALAITAHLLNALSFAHTSHVVHRDIKPDNVFLAGDGTVKLGDFGNARPFVTNAYSAGGGTYLYMAPEAFATENRFDGRSDLWSVGVVLYRMLTGQLPFRATPMDNPLAWKALLERGERPAPLRDLLPDPPNGLQGVISYALAFNKAERFPDADAFLDALKRNGLYRLPNTEAEMRRIDRFEAVYNRIDALLRRETGAGRSVSFSDVVRGYARQHPAWADEVYLLDAAKVRNNLRHELKDARQYRVPPSDGQIERLEGVEVALTPGLIRTDAKPAEGRGTDQPAPTSPHRRQPGETTADQQRAGEEARPTEVNAGATTSSPKLKALTEDGRHHPDDEDASVMVIVTEDGKWLPAPGYNWFSADEDDCLVVWTPGLAHPDHPNLRASADTEGSWIPARGYIWASSDRNDLRVLPIQWSIRSRSGRR